jgi:hypothetical protein
MANCRRTCNLFYYIKTYKYKPTTLFKEIYRCFKHDRKLTFEDTFMPFVCKIKGHLLYLPNAEWEPDVWVCRRCNRFVPNVKLYKTPKKTLLIEKVKNESSYI